MISCQFRSLIFLCSLGFLFSLFQPVLFAVNETSDPIPAENPIQGAETSLPPEPVSGLPEAIPESPDAQAKTGPQPEIAIRMLGNEMNIQVLYDHPMDQANNQFIEYIQMESSKGDFLGLSQFGPNAREAYAEFMVNPQLADFKEVVLIAKSSKFGEIRTPMKLELTEKPEIIRQDTLDKNRASHSDKGSEKKKKDKKKYLLF